MMIYMKYPLNFGSVGLVLLEVLIKPSCDHMILRHLLRELH
jgi:hypothetical protein